ncbi:MAG TPA: glycosyltransferase family 87 protein [Candidatus Limnocylindria bacterium]
MIQRLARLLSRKSTLVALAAASFLAADLVLIFVIGPIDFAFDFTCCYQQAGERLITDPSTLYQWSDTYTFRYTPLGALLFVPLVPLSAGAAAWAWLVIKLGVLGVTAVWYSRPWEGMDRRLVLLAVVAFPPIVHDLVIGNVSTITVLVLLAVARWPDARGGVALGLLLALMPKPHLIPVFVYLAIRQPRAFLASVATIGVAVLAGVALFGIDPWLEFAGTLREPLERTFTANIGFSGLLGPIGVVVGVAVAGVIFVVGARTAGARGYGLSIVAGIVAGPYTFIHYLAGSIVAAEPVLRTRPRRLAPFPSLLLVTPLVPIWLVGLAAVIRGAPEPSHADEAVGSQSLPGAGR